MIKTLKHEVAAISSAEPPVDYTVPQIKQRLKALIERIDIKAKSATNVLITLVALLIKVGCGGRT